ncbi:MAG TPA: protein phosphatase 2C domain-containing protein [Chthoniobacterales bacterium]
MMRERSLVEIDPSAPPTPEKVCWHGHTDRGRVRKNNEDSFVGLQFNAQEVYHLGKIGDGTLALGDFAFAVSDGMGGASAGEFASRIAVDKITRLLPRSFRLGAHGLSAGFEDVLEELFEQTHSSLVFLGNSDEDCKGMGTTLSLAWFRPGWMFFGHVGDSRIYYLPKAGGIQQISHDDTYVGWLYRNGQISMHEARNHPRRNILQKALGADHRYIDPQVGAVGCEPGDLFLICSDGLIEGLHDERILQLLRAPSAAEARIDPARRLVDQSVQQSGQDNTTALVVEILA